MTSEVECLLNSQDTCATLFTNEYSGRRTEQYSTVAPIMLYKVLYKLSTATDTAVPCTSTGCSVECLPVGGKNIILPVQNHD